MVVTEWLRSRQARQHSVFVDSSGPTSGVGTTAEGAIVDCAQAFPARLPTLRR
jgi:hypothetical protein